MARPTDRDRQTDPQAQAEAERTRVGHILRSARLSRDEDLKDVAAKLRIRHPYLDAIEEGRLGDLPGPTYAVGFVRAYADYLGLETEDVVARFKADSRALDAKAELVFPEPLPGGRVPGFALLLVAFVLGGLVYGGWLYISGQDRPVADIIPAVPDQLAELIDGARAPSPDAAPEAAQETTQSPDAEPAETPAPQGDADALPANEQAADEQAADEQAAAPSTEPAPDAPAEEASAEGAPTADAPTAEAPEAEAPAAEAAGSQPPAETSTAADADASPEAPTGTTPQPPIRSEEEIAAEAERAARQAADEAAAETERQAQQQASAAEQPTDDAPQQTDAAAQTDGATQPDAPETTAAAAPEVTQEPAPAIAAAPSAPEAPAPPAPSAESQAADDGAVFGAPPAESRVSITARVASWIEVTGPGGETLLARLLRAGETYRAPDRAGVTLVTGNAGGLEIVVDGARVPDIGPLGAVRRGVALDPEKLKAGVAAGG